MNKVRIIFNSFNVDAMLATAIVVDAIKSSETDDLKYNIETVPHSPINYAAPNSEYDFIFCIGVYLNKLELAEENSRTKNLFYISYGKDMSVEELKNVLGEYNNIFTPTYMWGIDSKSEEDLGTLANYSPCLSKLTIQALNRYFTVSKPIKELIKPSEREKIKTRLCSAIEKFYQNDKMQADELNLVHVNMDQITTAAHNATVIEYKDVEKGEEFKNSARTMKVRSIITKGLSTHLFGNQKNSMIIPTINCSEEYINDLIRLTTFATDNIVMYQDIKHARQWWIYSKSPSIAENIVSMIPHYRIHRDLNIIYLVSDTPSMLSK